MIITNMHVKVFFFFFLDKTINVKFSIYKHYLLNLEEFDLIG